MDVYELSKKLESKGFKVFYTNTIAETRGLLTELIGRTDTVGAGGSATLDEIGIGEALKERGNPCISDGSCPTSTRTKS